MPYTKTAVSIESRVYEAGEQLARELHLSRSELYTRALKCLLRQRKIRALQDQINAVEASLTDKERDDVRRLAEDLHHAASATMRGAIERGESTW